MVTGLVPDRAWTLERDGEALVLHAGADLRYALVDVAPAVADEILDAWQEGGFDRARLSAGAAEVLDQLSTAGALCAPAPADAAVAFVFVGHAVPGLEAGDVTGADLVVLVRTTGTLAELAERAAAVAVPHLVVDAAYHHTVVLGPLVVPGQTACVGCLLGRVTARWGDGAPPPEPAAARAEVTVALVTHEVSKAVSGASRLVNRTVTLDIDRWTSVDHAVLRLPWCTYCGGGDPNGAASSGGIDLPWAGPPEQV